ncbi:MAG: cytochrome c maturation protein CcmE [Chloroflexi bacterium]|nr:cytochrome c maturation protein CcmE [Chloroflexota bacterium]
MASDYEDSVSQDEAEESFGASSNTNRVRFLILGTVVVLSLGYMIYAAFPGNALYFLTVSEFMERDAVQDGRILRVSGKLVEGSFLRQDQSTLSHFQLTDEGAGLDGQQLRASYVGVLPDLFFNPHSEIILQGSYGTDNVFQADDILVKCPSKFQSLEEELSESG